MIQSVLKGESKTWLLPKYPDILRQKVDLLNIDLDRIGPPRCGSSRPSAVWNQPAAHDMHQRFESSLGVGVVDKSSSVGSVEVKTDRLDTITSNTKINPAVPVYFVASYSNRAVGAHRGCVQMIQI